MSEKEQKENLANIEELMEILRRKQFELEDVRIKLSQKDSMYEALLSQKDEQIAHLSTTINESRNVSFVRDLEEKLEEAEKKLMSTRKDQFKEINDAGSINGRSHKKSISSLRSAYNENRRSQVANSRFSQLRNEVSEEAESLKMVEVLQKALAEEELSRNALSTQNSILEKEIQKVILANKNLRQENQNLELISERLMHDLDAARTSEMDMKTRLKEEERAKFSAETMLDLKTQQITEAPLRNDHLYEEISNLKNENESLKRTITRLNEDFDSERKMFESELESIKGHSEILSAKLESSNQLIESKRIARIEMEREYQFSTEKIKRQYEEIIAKMKYELETKPTVEFKSPKKKSLDLPVLPEQVLQIEELNDIGELELPMFDGSVEALPRSVSDKSRKMTIDETSHIEVDNDHDEFDFQVGYANVLAELEQKNEEIYRLRKELLELRDQKDSSDLHALIEEERIKFRHLQEQKALEAQHFEEEILFLRNNMEEMTSEVIKAKMKYTEVIFEKDSVEISARRSIRNLEGMIKMYEKQISDFNSSVLAPN